MTFKFLSNEKNVFISFSPSDSRIYLFTNQGGDRFVSGSFLEFQLHGLLKLPMYRIKSILWTSKGWDHMPCGTISISSSNWRTGWWWSISFPTDLHWDFSAVLRMLCL